MPRVSVRSVLLRSVGAYLRRRQQNHSVPKTLDLARPEVRGAARLHYDRRRRPIREELEKLPSREPVAFDDLAWLVGHDDFEHRLREVNGDTRSVQHVGLLLRP
jgi:hypothetical protein